LVLAPGAIISGDGPLMAAALVGGTALVAWARNRRHDDEKRVLLALACSTGITIALAWLASQVNPAWTTRYFAVVLGAIVLLMARGFVLAGRLGVIALIAVVFIWTGYGAHNDKENARNLATTLASRVHPGELLISTHPEQVPVLRYYFGPGLRYANTFGAVRDPQAFDWADAVSRLRATPPQQTLDRLVATVPRGQELIVVTPVFRDYRAWNATWTKLVWQTATVWTSLLQHDSQLELVGHVSSNEIALRVNYFKPLQAFVYRRVR
jgi:mannosyltransferase